MPPIIEEEMDDDEFLSPAEREILDRVAPRVDEQPRADEHELVQGCASCSYNPDACGCGKYRDLMEEEELWNP